MVVKGFANVRVRQVKSTMFEVFSVKTELEKN